MVAQLALKSKLLEAHESNETSSEVSNEGKLIPHHDTINELCCKINLLDGIFGHLTRVVALFVDDLEAFQHCSD